MLVALNVTEHDFVVDIDFVIVEANNTATDDMYSLNFCPVIVAANVIDEDTVRDIDATLDTDNDMDTGIVRDIKICFQADRATEAVAIYSFTTIPVIVAASVTDEVMIRLTDTVFVADKSTLDGTIRDTDTIRL